MPWADFTLPWSMDIRSSWEQEKKYDEPKWLNSRKKSSLKSAPMLWIDLHFGFALRLSLSHSCTHLNRLTPMQERSWSFFYEQHQLLKVYTIHILILYIGWGPVAEWIGHHATTCWFWSTIYIALRSSLTCFMFWNTVGLPVQTSERWI